MTNPSQLEIAIVGAGPAGIGTAVADRLDLERGYRGLPVLDDETLTWRRTNGRRSSVFVTGALAAGTVGSLAGKIAGVRRAADRL